MKINLKSTKCEERSQKSSLICITKWESNICITKWETNQKILESGAFGQLVKREFVFIQN